MKFKKLISLFLCIPMVLSILSATASADMGPKPSVSVTISGTGGGTYYATLLSEAPGTGPFSAYGGGTAEWVNAEDRPIWQAFVDYQDSDGYYFLQEWWDCSDSNSFCWNYYPPSPFKILLYFPDSGTFLVSGILERYAFDSYYTIDLGASGDLLSVRKSYDYRWELISLVARILLTILAEVAIALTIFPKDKEIFAWIIGTNVFTQVALNVALNIIHYTSGKFLFYFILLEIIVFFIEATIYGSALAGTNGITKGHTRAYAFLSNFLSCILGLLLAYLIPGIF